MRFISQVSASIRRSATQPAASLVERCGGTAGGGEDSAGRIDCHERQAAAYDWERQKAVYRSIVDRLVA
mgnify:CR=1 FL=1